MSERAVSTLIHPPAPSQPAASTAATAALPEPGT
jgi:hypothetical protein